MLWEYHSGIALPLIGNEVRCPETELPLIACGDGIVRQPQEERRRGLDLPLLQQTLACYEEARNKTSGSEEVSNVAAYWANRGRP